MVLEPLEGVRVRGPFKEDQTLTAAELLAQDFLEEVLEGSFSDAALEIWLCETLRHGRRGQGLFWWEINAHHAGS